MMNEPAPVGSEELVCDASGCQLCDNGYCHPYACDSTSQCPPDYTCTLAGRCKPLSAATSGPSGTPVPPEPGTEEPAADAECHDDTQCEAMETCLDGACVEEEPVAKPESACVFNADCGPAGMCVDGECFFACAADGSCPVTQECNGSLCLPAAGPVGECVFGSDCAFDAICINATCIPVCAADANCGANEVCVQSLCSPDTAPKAQCLTATDCGDGMSCVEGRCLAPCSQWGECPAESTCLYGFCQPNFECRHTSECADGLLCVDGQCGELTGP
jgi:hypothetical protein